MKLYSLTQYHDALVQLILSYLVAGVATVAVFCRCWARRMKRADLWVDDYAAIGALVILWLLVAMQTADGKLGIRTHTKDLPAENLELMLKVLFAGQLLYSLCLLLGKSSYVFFYRRIFVTKSFKTATWVALAVICAWFVGNVLQVLLICRPIASNWDASVPATCGDRPVAYTVLGSINVATDATLMILPVPYIKKLQMSTSSKVGVSMTFLFGLLICAFSITRTIEVYKLDYSDPSYELLSTNFWSTVEPALLLANSCIPLLRPPLQSIFSRFWTKTRYATQYAFGTYKGTTATVTRPKSTAMRSKPNSRSRLSGYPAAMGNGGWTGASHNRSRVVHEDDEFEMVPGEPYTVPLPVRTRSDQTADHSDLEAGGILVQKDWSVTEEKVVDSKV